MNHIKQRKIKLIFPTIVAVLLTAVFVLFPRLAAANIGTAVADVLAWIAIPIIELLGGLIAVVVRLLIDVAQYNDFINSRVVSIGWVIIRDICNMLFVLIMIFIAFATVLKIEKYSYTKLLGAVFMAAILVNFSKLICGIIIDFSQVIMLTFVNAFKDAAEGNFINMLGLSQLMSMDTSVAAAGANVNKVGALILALVLSVVALFALFTMLVILLYRIIHLWFLVMVSPLAFVKNALPINIPGIGSNWWEEFGKEVVVGPLLAFFIWLSLSVVQEGSKLLPVAVDTAGTKISATASAIASSENLLAYIVGIFLLFTSITEAQKLSAYGGGFAGKMSGKLKQWGQGAVDMPFKPIKDRYQAAKAGWQESRSARKRARMAPFARLGQRVGELPTQLKGELKAGTLGVLGEMQARGGKKYYDMSKDSRGEAEALRERAKIKGGSDTTEGRALEAQAKLKEQDAQRYERMAKRRDVAGQALRAPVPAAVKGIKGIFGKKEESVEDLDKQIQEKEQAFKLSDAQINERAIEIKDKRMVGAEPGYTRAEIDTELRSKGVEPGTPEADEYMEKWDQVKAKGQLEKETREKPEYIEAQKEITQLKQARDQKRQEAVKYNLMPDEINAEINKLQVERTDIEIKAATLRKEGKNDEAVILIKDADKLSKSINELTSRLETARRATAQGEVVSRFGAEELTWVQKANVARYEDTAKKIPKETVSDEKKLAALLGSALTQTQGGAALLKLKDLHKDQVSKRQTDLGFDQYVEKHTGKSVKSWVERNDIPQEALDNHDIKFSMAKKEAAETPQPVIDQIFGDKDMQKYLDKLGQASLRQDFKNMEKALNNIAWLMRLQTKTFGYEGDVNVEAIGNLTSKFNDLSSQLKKLDPTADLPEKERLTKEIKELADKLKELKGEET